MKIIRIKIENNVNLKRVREYMKVCIFLHNLLICGQYNVKYIEE